MVSIPLPISPRRPARRDDCRVARIVVVGGLNMDLHLFGLHESPGQAPLIAERSLAQPGGKGANVARAAARHGVEVSLVGRVGDDDFGRACVEAVAADGVDTEAIVASAATPTGFVAIELREGRHRSLVFAPGANDELTWDDVEPTLARLGPSDIVVVQAEVPPSVLDRVTAHAMETGMTLFLDPTPPDRVRRQHLLGADVITPDLDEAARLVGRRPSSLLWPPLAARELVAAGARRVVVKTAEEGAVLADRDAIVEIPTVRVDVADETGAGDVFLAALAVRRLEGADWEEAVGFANTASALSVAATGLALPGRVAIEDAHRQVTGAVTPVDLDRDRPRTAR